VDESLIWTGNLRAQDVTVLCREKLSGGSKRPDALFSTNGPTALGVLRAFHECGLRTPEDVAFATFDELNVEDIFSPSITTVAQPAYNIGYRAAEILLDRINGVAPEGTITLRLPAHLEVRSSSARRAKRVTPIADGDVALQAVR